MGTKQSSRIGRDSKWPLVGRADDLELIASMMRDGRGGVVIAGPAGVGKTRLGLEALALGGRLGLVPLRVTATKATAGIPLGAFSNILPDLEELPLRADLIRETASAISGRGQSSPVVLLVDDAHLLDELSAALVFQLVQESRSVVLITIRSGEAVSDAITVLWKDGLTDRLELGPLSATDTEELISKALGGPIDGATAALLHQRAGGNVLFLRELVRAGLDTGALRTTQGLWRLAGELSVSSRLVEILDRRMTALSPIDRSALQLLALGEPLELPLFRQLKPGLAVEWLEQRGMIKVELDGRRMITRLEHPLYADVLRAKLGGLRIQEFASMLAGAVEQSGGRRSTDLLRMATWRLQAGGPFNGPMMLKAAISTKKRKDLILAERFARAAVDAGTGFDAELLVGQLLWHQGRAREAAKTLGAVLPTCRDDAQKARLASSLVEVFDLGLADSDAALAAAEEVEAQIVEASYRDQIAIERARILGRRGRHGAAVAVIEPLLGRAKDRQLVTACFAAGTSMKLTGQISRALEVTELGYETQLQLSGPPMGYGPLVHRSFHCGALMQGGWLEQARKMATVSYSEAVKQGSPEEQGFLVLALAMIEERAGRLEATSRWSAETAGVFSQLGWPLMQRCGLIVLALARAQQGKGDEAMEVLVELEGLNVPAEDIYGPMLLQARAWTEVAKGNLDRATELLWDGVAMARAGGARVLECAALHDLARLGKASQVVDMIELVSAHVEGPFPKLRTEHVRALALGDPELLEQASSGFEALGSILLAAEALADAAVAWQKSGDLRRATAAQQRSAVLAARCEGARTPALMLSVTMRAALTDRELEISRLAASGLTSKQIAKSLFLSPRTVDNKLLSVYEKLGVKRRTDLASALTGYPDQLE
jgi:DNA-binding CsgD family transcriptional regulator